MVKVKRIYMTNEKPSRLEVLEYLEMTKQDLESMADDSAYAIATTKARLTVLSSMIQRMKA